MGSTLRNRVRFQSGGLVTLVCMAALGCRSDGPDPAATALSADDFRVSPPARANAAERSASTERVVARTDPERARVFEPPIAIGIRWDDRIGPAQAVRSESSDPDDARAELSGTQEAPAPRASSARESAPVRSEPSQGGGDPAPGERIITDSIVGDINGKPVYASEFFEELDARFRAEAQRLPRGEFLSSAQSEIRRKLNEMLEREVLRAEAIASLPDEARQFGIQAFLSQIRENTIRRQGGTEAGAARAVGGDLDRYARDQTEQQLIQFEIQQQISERLNITWREIRQEYERRYGEFNPDPVAVLRWIRVRASDEQDVAEITGLLESGASFERAASSDANGYEPDLGGLLSKSFSGEYKQASFVALSEVNEAARSLDPGEMAGPIESRGFINWIKLERIERRQTPLYDVQLLLEIERRRQLGQRELDRYIRRLRDRASFTDLDEMTARLLRIAAERYLPAQG